MSYESSVVADNPALYYRLDMAGVANDGDTIPDASGNDLDGSLIYSGSVPPYGYPSPIETDPSSREFWGWTNASIDSLAGASRIVRESDSVLEPVDNVEFACEGWLRPLSGMYAAVVIPLIGKAGTGGICYGVSASGQRIGGFCYDSANTLWTVFDTSFEFTDFLGISFHIVVTRIANSLALYINNTLRGSTTITSGLNTRFDNSIFSPAFVHEPSVHYLVARYDEFAWYTHTLSAGSITNHWNAARFAIALSGSSDGKSTATLSSQAGRPVVDFPFQHNLNVDIRETLEYLTPTITSFDVTEQRMSNRTNPRRTLEYVISPSGEGKIRRLLHSTLFKGQVGPYRLPIFADGSIVEKVEIGDTVFTISTDGKDYDIGGELRIWKDESTFEYCAISNVQPTTVTISPGTLGSYDRAIIEPVRRCYLNGDGDIESIQTSIENFRIMFDVDTREVSSNRFTAFTPSLEYNGLEVFSLYQLRLDFQETSQQQVHRFEDRVDYNAGAVATIPRIETDSFVLPLTLTITDRSRLGELLGWFKYRAGRRVPLWVPSFQRDFKVTEKFTGSIDTTFKVEFMGYSANYAQNEARRDIAFIKSDGTIICRRITNSLDNENGTETLTVNSALGGEYNTDFDRVSFLFPSRLDHDRLELTYKGWSRGGAVEAMIRFVTLAHEIVV